MQMVLLTGYRYCDFSPKDDPNKRIKGYSVYLCTKTGDEKDGVYGVMPISDGGKRFINADLCDRLGITSKFLSDNLYDFIGVDFDINGKFTEFRALTADEKRNNPDYPFDSDSKGEKGKSDADVKDYPF